MHALGDSGRVDALAAILTAQNADSRARPAPPAGRHAGRANPDPQTRPDPRTGTLRRQRPAESSEPGGPPNGEEVPQRRGVAAAKHSAVLRKRQRGTDEGGKLERTRHHRLQRLVELAIA